MDAIWEEGYTNAMRDQAEQTKRQIARRVEDCTRRIAEAEASLRGTRDCLMTALEELDLGGTGAQKAETKGAQDSGKKSSDLEGNELEGYRVNRKHIIRYLRKEKAEQEACMLLPAAATLLFVFTLMVSLHFRIDTLQAVDTALSHDIIENANFAFSGIIPFENGRMGHKNVFDVNSIADFWSWFTLGLVPLWWPDQSSYGSNEVRSNVGAMCSSPRDAMSTYGYTSHSLENVSDVFVFAANGDICPGLDYEATRPATVDTLNNVGEGSIAHTWLYFNSVVGGARLLQEQADVISCPSSNKDMVQGVHGGQCVRDEDYWLYPDRHRSLRINEDLVNRQGGETIYLLSYTSQQEVLHQLEELEARGWFNPSTSKIEIMFTTYNPHMNLLTTTFIMMYLNRAGHIHKVVEPLSIWLDPYHGHSFGCYFFDLVWFILLSKILVEETREVIKTVRLYGIINGLAIYLNLSNAVDWVCLSASFVLFVMWLHHLVQCQHLQMLLAKGNIDVRGSWLDHEDVVDFFDAAHYAVVHQKDFFTCLGVYPFVMMSRFMKAFNSQPRLSLVTRTLSTAAVDILHFGIVFFTAFFVFALSGWLLFGREQLYFANFSRSIHTTFRTILGDFEWQSLTEVGRAQSYVWFWALMWLIPMISLNMLLAIVMDCYSSVRSEIFRHKNVETMWSQAFELYKRFRGNYDKTLLPLDNILVILNPDGLESDELDGPEGDAFNDDFMNIVELQAKVPDLPETQAADIIAGGKDICDVDKTEPSFQECLEASSDCQSTMHEMKRSQEETLRLIKLAVDRQWQQIRFQMKQSEWGV